MDKNNGAFCMQVRRKKIERFAAGFYEEKPRREAHQIQPIASLKMKGRVSVH
jgi:hypothetical protein